MDYTTMFRLDGRVAAITGGARGIGLEVARALGAAGATVVLLDQDEAAMAEAKAGLEASGLQAATMRLDVTRPEEAEAVAGAIAARFGRVDVLVNNAGIARITPALETPDEEWRLVMDVNLNGVFWCARAFGRVMVRQGSGAIVNLGSMSGTIVNRPQAAAAYIASKGAVHMLTKALAAEWAETGVRVNAVAPGYIATDMTLAMRARPELFDVWLDSTPMKRCGEPSEVAAAILFLACPAASYVTGAIHAVDGGYTAW